MSLLTTPFKQMAPSRLDRNPRNPVRVCFLIDELSRAGTETQLLALIQHMDRRRIQPFLCLLRGDSESSRQLEPVDTPVLRLGVGSLRAPKAFKAAWQFGRFLRRERIDVLQTYFPDSTYFGVVVGRVAGVRHVVRTRNNLGHWLTPCHRLLGRMLNPLTTATVANCEAARTALLASEGPSPAKVIVLENGVDLERFTEVAALETRRPRRVGIVANLRPVKGLDVLIDAAAQIAAQFPDATFEVAGEGNERKALVRQIERLGLMKRFHLRGAIADIPRFLSTIDIAALSSRAEGMSNAVLEYMAAGRAIVATDVGACARLLAHGQHGVLVPPGEANAMARAMGDLMKDGERACRLGASARGHVETKYSRQAMVRRFESFYLHLMEDR